MVATQENRQLSLRAFILLSWHYKWFILTLTAVFAVASVFIALSIPNQYKAEVLLTSSEEQQGGGLSALASQMGGLASLAGINLGGKANDRSLIALKILQSRKFLMNFIEEHSLLVPLMASKGWDQQSQHLLIDENKYDSAQKKWVRKVSYPKQVVPTLFEAYEVFIEMLMIKTDVKVGTYTLTMEFYSPYLATQWLKWLVADLNRYMLEDERKKSQKSIEYLQLQIAETQVAELKRVFYQLIQDQTQKAMLAEAREEFMFKTIDEAILPEKKSKPSRVLICIVITLFGSILALLLVHIRQAFLLKPNDQSV